MDKLEAKPGAVVFLKSGGPAMVMLHGSKSIMGDWWLCTWIDNAGLAQSHEFPIAALRAKGQS